MKKVKVKILQTRHPLYKVGDVVEFSEEKARFAAANKWAEVIEEKTTRKTATSKKAENRTTATTARKSSKKSTSRRGRKRKTNKK